MIDWDSVASDHFFNWIDHENWRSIRSGIWLIINSWWSINQSIFFTFRNYWWSNDHKAGRIVKELMISWSQFFFFDFDQNYTRKLWTILGLSFGIPARRRRAKIFNLFWTLNDLMIIYIVKICNLMINQMIRIFPDPEFVINQMIRIFLDPEFVINQMIRIFEISRWWSIIWQVWLIINTSWSIKI